MTRPPLSLLIAGLVILIGMAGLVRGAVPQSAGAGRAVNQTAPIVVGGAYVREPATLSNAAVYFTVFNTSDTDDLLTAVRTGAGAQAPLHSEDNQAMTVTPAGVTIPAHGSVTLSPGKGHLMIEKLYGRLLPGQTVNLQFDFSRAGSVLVPAPVIAIAAPAPGAVTPK